MSSGTSPSELETAVLDLLRHDKSLASREVSPRQLLRRLLATTDLSLRYPDDIVAVTSALRGLEERYPLAISLGSSGLASILDATGLASPSDRSDAERPAKRRRTSEDAAPPARSHLDRLLRENFIDRSTPFVEICEHSTRAACNAINTATPCDQVHFQPIVHAHTDRSLGHCSYLNTCYRPEICRYLHFEIEEPPRTIDENSILRGKGKRYNGMGQSIMQADLHRLPAQWLNCDLRALDAQALDKFEIVMADPPWDIHQTLPYGTMTDDEMKLLPVPALQNEGGLLFLWVTGRAMDVGRDCLVAWGYERIDEIVWVKTNQLQRIIRTGRTGHWLNHSKEHCLVAYKKSSSTSTTNAPPSAPLKWANRGMDTDVIVSEVRETSRKPDEIYSVIERVCPGGRKLELFGRLHNTRPGWLTLGNQLGSNRLFERDMVDALNRGRDEDDALPVAPVPAPTAASPV